MSYHEYLKSDHWKKFRKLFFAKKKCKHCQFCGSKGKLDLHHRTYERLGKEQLSDVVAICRRCHDEIHDLLRSGTIKSLIRATNKVKKKYQNSPTSVLRRTSTGKARKRAYQRATEIREELDVEFYWMTRGI